MSARAKPWRVPAGPGGQRAGRERKEEGMRTHRFGGRDVSVIGLGSGEFGGACPEGKAREFLDAFSEMGGNLIDTAHVYGDFKTPRNGESERVIGRWMADRHCRDRVFLSTKGGHPPLSDMKHSRLSREEIRADWAESLEALQTDRVDIYWLHRDDENRPVGEIMETLQELIEDGSVALLGASNWSARRIREANAYAAGHGLTPFAANQPQFSLAKSVFQQDRTLQSMWDEGMWKMHREWNFPCFCFSSQAHGFFTKLDALGEENLPENVKRKFLSPENLAIYQRIKNVQAETGLPVGAVALAFLTCQPFPCFALAGASSLEQVTALREAGDAVLTLAQRDYLKKWPEEGSAGRC